MNRVKEMIIQFCKENNDRYKVFENKQEDISDKSSFGIVVKAEFSYMEMLSELTVYLNNMELSGEELEFAEGIQIELLQMDTVVYFPRVN